MTHAAPARGTLRRVLLGTGVGVLLVLVVLVVVLGASGSRWALPAGAGLASLPAIVGGILIVRSGLGQGGRARFRVLLGLAATVWGAGQLVLCLQLLLSRPTFPTAGDAISTIAAPLALAGLVLVPRRVIEPLQTLRLALEALMLGGAATVLVWRLVFRDVMTGSPAADVGALAVMTLDLTLVALLFIAASREADRGLLLVLVGGSLYVAADLTTLHEVLRDGIWPWQAAVVACVAWLLIAIGLLQVTTTPPDQPDRLQPAAEFRRLVSVGAVLFLLLSGTVLTLGPSTRVDTIGGAMVLLLLIAMLCRELVRASQARQLMGRMSALASQDPLTGLPNRRALAEELDVLVHAAPSPWTFLTLDLDGFKDVNELLGHETGDALLQRVARGLEGATAPHGARAYRLGGDEFAVLAPGDDDAAELAQQLLTVVESSALAVPGVGRVDLGVSIGTDRLVVGPHGSVPTALVTMAQSGQAMRQAKRDGRGRVVRFSEPLAARTRRRATMAGRLREQVDAGGVQAHFQPVLDLATGYLVGLEALARWTDPALGPVNPQEFIEVAEEAGLITRLGEQMLRTSLAGGVASGAFARDVTMGVNVSTLQLRDPGFVAMVGQVLQETGVPPAKCVIEVTESVFVRPDDPAVQALFALADMGLPIALDDFGTGYSSLGYLSRLPVRILKVDRSLTSGLGQPKVAAIARSIVHLANGLDLDVLFEGVETAAEEKLARDAGAQFVQGWYYARAMPVEQLPAALARMCDPATAPVPAQTGDRVANGSARPQLGSLSAG